MHKRTLFSLLVAVALAATEQSALAAPPACSSLPNPVYLQIGDTQEPLIKALGQALRNSTVFPMTIVYITAGSCTNIDAFYTNTPITVNPLYIPSTAEDPTWTPTSPSPTCTIDPGGHAIDVANSNVAISACTTAAPPAGINTWQGSIQAYVFAVPKASSQTAITAEEAYFTFGFGAQGQVTPWVDPTFYFIRPTTKSTLVSIAANIGVPPAKWQGVPFDKSTQVVNALATSTSPEKSIGILGAEIYDANRATLSSLAYRAYGQYYAYWPDSTQTATDKQNLRDGHYTIWSPTVYMAHVDSTGTPTNANAAYLLPLILNQPVTPTPDFNPLDIVISKGLVPQCAMKVSRPAEGADLALYAAPAPCGCYFESKVGTTSCTACSATSPCSSGVCRLGYCEAY